MLWSYYNFLATIRGTSLRKRHKKLWIAEENNRKKYTSLLKCWVMNKTMMSPIGFCFTWRQSHYSACYNEHANSLQIVCLYICYKVVLIAKNLTASAGDMRHRFNPWVRKIPWRRTWQPSTRSRPENPMDREAWRATAHGITQSWVGLKQLSLLAHHDIMRALV